MTLSFVHNRLFHAMSILELPLLVIWLVSGMQPDSLIHLFLFNKTRFKHGHCIYLSGSSRLTMEHLFTLFHTAHLCNSKFTRLCAFVSSAKPLLVVSGVRPCHCCHHSAVFLCVCVQVIKLHTWLTTLFHRCF